LLEYSWPGNVRELESVLARCAIDAAGRELTADNVRSALEPTTKRGPTPAPSTEATLSSLFDKPFHEARRAFEDAYLEHAILRNPGNVSNMAREIGLNRQYTHVLLRRRGLRFPSGQGGDPEPS